MAIGELEIIKQQSKKLAPEQRAELVRFLTESMTQEPPQSQPLKFGKYAGRETSFSTDADFSIAEWNPMDSELNGN